MIPCQPAPTVKTSSKAVRGIYLAMALFIWSPLLAEGQERSSLKTLSDRLKQGFYHPDQSQDLIRLLGQVEQTGDRSLGPAVEPYLRHKDPEVRKAAIEAASRLGHFASAYLVKALKTEISSSLKAQIYLALAAINGKPQRTFLERVILNQSADELERLNALRALTIMDPAPLPEPLFDVVAKNSLKQASWARSGIPLLRQSRLNERPKLVNAFIAALPGRPDLAPLIPALDFASLNTAENWSLGPPVTSWMLWQLQRTQPTPQLPPLFWQLGTDGISQGFATALWLQFVRTYPEKITADASAFLNLARKHPSAWVQNHALKTWFELSRKQPGAWASLEALSKKNNPDLAAAALEIMAAYGPKALLPAIMNRIALLPGSQRALSLRGLRTRPDLPDLNLGPQLFALLPKAEAGEIILLTKLLSRIPHKKQFATLSQLYRQHPKSGHYRIRQALLEAIAATEHEEGIAFYRTAARDPVAEVRALAMTLYKKATGHPLRTEMTVKEEAPLKSSSKSSRDWSQTLFLVKTNKGAFRIRLDIEHISSLAPLMEAAMGRSWEGLRFQEITPVQINLPMLDLPQLEYGRRLKVPSKYDLVIQASSAGVSDAILFLREDVPSYFRSHIVIGEVISGTDIIDALEPEDQIQSVGLEQIVGL